MSQEWLDQIKAFLSSADAPQLVMVGIAAAGTFLLLIAMSGFLTLMAWKVGTGSLKLSWLMGRGSAFLLCRGASWSASKAFGWIGSRQPQELARTLLDALNGPAKRDGEYGLNFSGCFVGLSGGDYIIQAHGEDAGPLLYKWERKAIIAKAKQVIALIAACDLADRKALLVRMVRLSAPHSSEDGINNEPKSKHVMGGIPAAALKLPKGTGEVRCRELDGGISRLVVDPASGLTTTGDVGNGIISRANGIRTH